MADINRYCVIPAVHPQERWFATPEEATQHAEKILAKPGAMHKKLVVVEAKTIVESFTRQLSLELT